MKLKILAIVIIIAGNVLGNASLHSEPKIQYTATKNKSQKECQLKFGWQERAPLQFTNSAGKLQGLQIELTQSIVKEMKCSLVYVKARWPELIEMIRAGEIDFIAGASTSPVRQNFAYFSNTYRQDAFAVYVLKEKLDSYKINSLSDLSSTQFKLGINDGFLYGDFIERWKKDEKHRHLLKTSRSTEESVVRLRQGHIDGFLEDPFVISYKIRSENVPANLEALPIKIFGLKSNFMFSKKTVSPEFINRFNVALKSVLESSSKYQVWLGSW